MLGLVVFALVVLAITRWVDVDAWRDEVAQALSGRLGLDVRIAGRMQVDFGLHPGLTVTDIEVRTPGRPDDAPIARFDAMDFDADLARSLRQWRPVLSQARASGVEIALRRDASGEGNWQIPGGRSAGGATAQGVATRMPLELVVLERVRLTYETAISDWAFELELDRLDVMSPEGDNRFDIESRGTVQGHDFAFTLASTSEGPASTPLLGPGTALALETSGHVGPLEFSASGRLEEPLGEAHADFGVSLHVDDIGALREVVRISEKLDLAGLGALDARARLVGGAGSVALEQVEARVAGPQTGRVEGRGRIADLVRGAGIDLAFSVDMPDVGAVARRLRIPCPDAREGSGTGRLEGRWPEVRFADIDVGATHRLGGSLRARGEVARVGRAWAADLDLAVETARAGDVATLIEEVVASVRRDGPPVRIGRPDAALQQALMEIGPVEATGRLLGEDRAWKLVELRGLAGTDEVHWLRGQGSIASLVPRPSEIAIELEAGTDDLVTLSERAGRPIAGLERLRVHGHVSGDSERLVLRGMQAVATTPGRITMGVNGDLPVGDNWRDMQATVAVSARDFGALGEVLDRALPPVGPLELRAQVYAEGDALVGEAMVVALGDSRIHGDLRITPGPERPFVTADLASERLQLRDLGLSPAADESDASSLAGPGWLDWPIPFEDIRAFDGRLAFRIDHLVGREGFDVADIRLRPQFDDGVLQVDNLALAFEGGRADVSLRVDANAQPARVVLDARGDGFRIERVVAQLVEERVATGVGQLVVDLRARGSTPRALGRSMTGDVFFYGRAGGLSMRYSHALQIDLGSEASRRAARGELERVTCLVVDVAAYEGRLSLETLLLDTEDKQVLGSGQVDLVRSEVDLLLTPVFKQTIPGSVATAVRIHGPLTDADVTPAPLLTASATAQGLIDRALLPLRRVLPGVASAVDDLRRSADRALEGTGVTLPAAGLWRPGIDVTCDKLLRTRRIETLRSGRTPGERPESQG